MDKLAGLVSFSSGKSIGGILTALPFVAGLRVAVIGVGLGAGGVFSLLMTRGRRELNMQANLKSWCEADHRVAARVRNDFARRMVDVQEELRVALADHIDRRRQELDWAIAQVKRVPAGGRSGQLAAAEAEAKRIRELLGSTDRVLAAMGSFRVAAPAIKGKP